MKDVVDSFTGASHRGGITQVHFPKVDPVIKSSQVGSLPGQVVIQSPDFITAVYQGARQRRSDEARDSCNQVGCHAVNNIENITPGPSEAYCRPVRAGCAASSDICCMYFLE